MPLPGWATWPLVPPGGLEPPRHGLRTRRAALTLRRGTGADPGDRTRTTAIPGPQAAVTSDQRWSEWRDSNPHLKAWKARRQPLPHIRIGSAYGYRTRPSALATRDASSTPRPNVDRYRSPAHRLLSVVKDPALASWWAARDSNPIAPLGRTGLRPVSGPSTRTARVGDSARIRTRTHEVWRLGCFRYTTLSLLLHISTVSETEPPHDLTRAFCRASDQNKKGLLGDRPRRPGSQRMQGL